MLYAQKSDDGKQLSDHMLSSGSLKRRAKGSGKPPKGKKMKDRDFSPYKEMINQNSEKEIG